MIDRPTAAPYGVFLPPPPVPPRSNRRWWWLLGIAMTVLALVLAGATVIGTRHLLRSTRTPTAATPHAKLPPVSTLTAGDGPGLKAYLLQPPAGTSTERIFNSSFGIQTAAQFATSYADHPNEEARLTGQGYAVGASVAWADPRLGRIMVSLLQFRDDDGATSFALGSIYFHLNDKDMKHDYPLVGYPNGYDFEDNPDASDTAGAALIATDGTVVLEIWFTKAGIPDRAAETAFFQRQYAILIPQPWTPSTTPPTLAPQQTVPLIGKPAAAIPTGDGAALLRHLAPADSVATFPVGGSPEGVLSVADLAGDTTIPMSDMQTMGVRAAAANNWRTADGIQVFTRLVRFRTPAGAASYFQRRKTYYFRFHELGTAYPLTGAGPAYGFEMTAFNSSGSRSFDMVYQDGSIVIELDVYTLDHMNIPASIAQLQRQIDALARP